MIISRTPFRISFFGGGTDYPVWYEENGGEVLSTTIDKYCYITCRYLPPFFEHKHRLVYSKIEMVKEIEDILHPSARELLKYLEIENGVEIHHDGDLPARSGLGSSSSFTVGLLHALYALKEHMPSKLKLAKEAIHIERNVLKEYVGSQDQVAVAFGGFNRVKFYKDETFEVEPIILPGKRRQELREHLLLFFTGFSRFASEVAKRQIEMTPNRKSELAKMQAMVPQAIDILSSQSNIQEFGKLLDESWKLKRSLSDKISNPEIDGVYERAKRAGALGGKLLGAGG
ncbi:MAG: kinase, partial [Candidatus Margulisiibacteriota bacterium]